MDSYRPHFLDGNVLINQWDNGTRGPYARRPRIVYEYMNTPIADKAHDSMHAHGGTQWLNLRDSGGQLELVGDYYTGRDRQTFGTVRLVKQK